MPRAVRPVYTLLHADEEQTYVFRPGPTNVVVTFRSARDSGETYTVPLAEARDLWRRLLQQGYRRI